MTGTELTVPALRGLSLREVWDLEDKLDDAKTLVSDYIDSEVRRLAGEGWTQTRIAAECGRDQSTVSRRMARLEIQPPQDRGGRPRGYAPCITADPPVQPPRYPEVVQFGVPAETQETMAASLDAMPEPDREESLAKIRGEHGSWERKDAMAALAGLPPMPRPDQAPPPGSESAIDDLVSAWDAIGAAIRDALAQDRQTRGDNALTDSQLYRLDTARERVQEETAVDARPAPDESELTTSGEALRLAIQRALYSAPGVRPVAEIKKWEKALDDANEAVKTLRGLPAFPGDDQLLAVAAREIARLLVDAAARIVDELPAASEIGSLRRIK